MEKFRKITLILLLGILSCGYGTESSQNKINEVPKGSSTHNFEEVAPGVYLATGKGPVNVGSNAMVVVNENDVVLVDSHITPDAARELIQSVKTLTDKPIHYLVNTHFHHDHAHGNQVFPEGVAIIGHEYTRERLLGDVLTDSTFVTIASAQYEKTQIAILEKQVAEAEGDQKTSLESQLTTLKRHTAALSELAPTPPNTTLKRKLTLYRGEREIQMHHLGRGHTGGDVIVFLPAEKVVFTGDLLPATAPYLGDSWPEEFIETLEKLRSLDFDTILPGHGPVIRDLSHIDFTQNYIRKYWESVKASHSKGFSIDEATVRFDMSGYENYAPFQLGRPEARRLEVVRMYQLLDGKD